MLRARIEGALVIVYHDIGPGRSPLCLSADLLRDHLDCIAACGATAMTVSALGQALRRDQLPPRPVCLTFDDCFSSVVDEAAPLLQERGFPGTLFAVAGHLGGTNAWPSQPGWVERRPLAEAAQLAELATAGFEIGAHGFDHMPLSRARPEVVHRELVEAKDALEQAVGVQVESLAYPYGSLPAGESRALVARTYAVACTTTPRLARAGDDLTALPRVDAHYVRRIEVLRRILGGSGRAYLGARRTGRRLRSLVVSDWAAV